MEYKDLTKEVMEEHCAKHLCVECPFYRECPIWKFGAASGRKTQSRHK